VIPDIINFAVDFSRFAKLHSRGILDLMPTSALAHRDIRACALWIPLLSLADCLTAAYIDCFEFRPNELALPRLGRACLTTFPNLEPTGCVNARPNDGFTKELPHG
jgi:hypothetical protein